MKKALRLQRNLAWLALSMVVVFFLYSCGGGGGSSSPASTAAPAPTAATTAATQIGTQSAVLNGTVNPNAQATNAWLEWGTDNTLSSFTATPSQAIGAGTTPQAVSATITGLTPGTPYYYRVAATNASGTQKGTITSFTIALPNSPPTVTTAAADNVTITGAVLHGSVIPNELPTTAWFEWGTDSNLATFSTTASQSMGAGNTSVQISNPVSLSAGTTYYFRVAATNSAGTSKGVILTFNTVAQPPTVTTAAAMTLTIDSAHLEGTVNPNGLATNAWAEWGTEPTLATWTPTSPQNLGSALTGQPFDAPVASLSPGTTYYFRVAAINPVGTSKGSIVSFTTTAEAPAVTTAAATSVTSSSAGVNGNVNPNGLATNSWFEWGTDSNLASYTSTPVQSTGSGKSSVPVNASLSSLSAGTTYYFRVAAVNSAGTSKGAILNFTTLLTPTVITKTPSSITKSGAVLNGQVNPNGLSTNGWFEYGTDPSLASHSSTGNQSLGTGTSPVSFSASVSLSPNTTYYYRAAASNSNGTQEGPIKSFLTAETYVAVGDSITEDSHDDIPGDGIGYEPILGDLLGAMIANEGVSGTTSADGAGSISATLSKYPYANYYLVLYGTNDASAPVVPSGMGLSPGNPGYIGSYKDNMQKIISAILAAGKTPYLAKVPWTSIFSDAAIQEYNVVIDELRISNGIVVTPPDFYAWFKSHPGQLADGIHPNGTGCQSIADLWFNALP